MTTIPGWITLALSASLNFAVFRTCDSAYIELQIWYPTRVCTPEREIGAWLKLIKRRKEVFRMFRSTERAGEELMGVGRTLRVVRLLRAGRLLISVPEIYILMSGLTSALKPIIFGSIMLISVSIIWAIIVVEFLHPVNALPLGERLE